MNKSNNELGRLVEEETLRLLERGTFPDEESPEAFSQWLKGVGCFERRAYDRAVSYQNEPRNRYTLSFLFDLYLYVDSLTRNRGKFSYSDIAQKFSGKYRQRNSSEIINLSAPSVRRILMHGGLKSSNHPVPKRIFNDEDWDRIRRGLNYTSLPILEIARLCRVSTFPVRAVYKMGANGGAGRVEKPGSALFADFGPHGKLGPSKASEIYRLVDAGVKIPHILRKLKISQMVFGEAVANRCEYSGLLIGYLEKIYDRKFEMPYVE
jgi:hypothetical protein